MKIDTHVHSSGISKCSRVTYEEIVKNKLNAGYNGAVLMNHCQPWYYEPQQLSEWIEDFIQEFKKAYNYGKEQGFTFFLGIEVSVNIPRWADFLIFGVTEEFLKNAPDMCRISQKELYEYCKQYGALMVQAHPLRPDFELLDVNYMDGVELNLSNLDISTHAQVEELANAHGLALTVGTDYHSASSLGVGGLIIPDGITNSVELCNYLKQSKQLQAFIGDKITLKRGFAK